MTESQLSQANLTRLRMTLGRLGRVLRQQSDDGLSYTLVSLVFAIGRLQPVSASDLAASENVSPPSVTRSLSKLTELGLISRESDPKDRRAALIQLSAKGEKEREELLRSREIWLSEHVKRLGGEDVSLLLAALPALERLCDPELP